MQAGAENLGVIEARYASAIFGVLSPVSSHCLYSVCHRTGRLLRKNQSVNKSLKVSHSIEPAPQRLATPHTAAAEDPVTARIRCRIDLPAAYEPAVEPERPASPAITEPVFFRLDAAPPAPAKPKPTYQVRVTRNKPRKARQMSLF